MATQTLLNLIQVIKNNSQEILKLVSEKPDWDSANKSFDALFIRMSNPNDPIWTEDTIKQLNEIYYSQRDKDKGMSNITLRTIAGMPENLKNDTKKIFLQTAEVCCIFNASHKVNFEAEEIPADFDEVRMIPSKTKGVMTYAQALPALYKKTSLTFDYWIPKILEWTNEIRSKNLNDWKGDSIHQYESCTDFMRICLLFLSDHENNPTIAKTEDREALLNLFEEDLAWIKKSAKREDINHNNVKIKKCLTQLNEACGIEIPHEAWGRILYSPSIKPLFK